MVDAHFRSGLSDLCESQDEISSFHSSELLPIHQHIAHSSTLLNIRPRHHKIAVRRNGERILKVCQVCRDNDIVQQHETALAHQVADESRQRSDTIIMQLSKTIEQQQSQIQRQTLALEDARRGKSLWQRWFGASSKNEENAASIGVSQ